MFSDVDSYNDCELEISVWSKHETKSDDLLGHVSIKLGDKV